MWRPSLSLSTPMQSVAKKLSHHAKFRSVSITSGDPRARHMDAFAGYVDLVVATPGRLLRYLQQGVSLPCLLFPRPFPLDARFPCARRGGWHAGDFKFSDVKYVVLDEADTLLCDNFSDDVAALLEPVMVRAGCGL